ncbi:ABC-three component system middle component 2 [Hyphomonas sp. NPDC076900]|uniref:ABC-three component system middle component 2 n=1 Tax=unclassified Hyphomonas TaxID=2630699 RepID=UPI003D0928F1
MSDKSTQVFNSPFETGVRALILLVASFPRKHDLKRLVQYDYLSVHSADAGGPPSLHPPLPLRSNELLVRRSLVERGLLLMASAGLVRREAQQDGIVYTANDDAGAFVDNLYSDYLMGIKNRAGWVAETFDDLLSDELDTVVNGLFEAWTTEFQSANTGLDEFPL